MSKFIHFLCQHLSSELQIAIASDLSESLRLFFSGPPKGVLERLFVAFTQDQGVDSPFGTATQGTSFPVYLLDEAAVDPEGVPRAARCTNGYFINSIRNHRDNRRCLVLQDRDSSMLSVYSTVSRIGIIPRDRDDLEYWLRTRLVDELVRNALADIMGTGDIDAVYPAIHHVFKEAWDQDERHPDKPTAWGLLETLCDRRVEDSEPHVKLGALIGLPNCGQAAFAGKSQLSVLGRLADFLESHGLQEGFKSLRTNAEDSLVQYIDEFHAHLNAQCVDGASNFKACPCRFYSPVSSSSNEIPAWWRNLTVDAWLKLLEAGLEPDPDGKLQVRVLNLLGSVPRGLPAIVRDEVVLQVQVSDCDKQVEVVICRASGNAKVKELGRVCVAGGVPTEFRDTAPPEHERFIKYVISADGFEAVNVKVIAMERYGPGVVCVGRGAIKGSSFTLKPISKVEANPPSERYSCEITLQGIGTHQLDFYTSSDAILSNTIRCHEVDAEHSAVEESRINRFSPTRSVALIETDEESFFDFTVSRRGSVRPYRIEVTADDVDAAGASSEFDRLVLEHRASARRDYSHARVEAASTRSGNLEEWILESEDSYHPLIIGPDFLDEWGEPTWRDNPVLSKFPIYVDPRPAVGELVAPAGFIKAREAIRRHLISSPDQPTPTASTIRFHELMREGEFVSALKDLLDAYLAWLASDYAQAAWADVVAVHDRQRTADALNNEPYAVMLTPFHPIRLAWQCHAQKVLQQAIDEQSRCPAASTLTPAAFPDCLVLPCRSATGQVHGRAYAAMATNSDYWSVLWSINAIGNLGGDHPDRVFGNDLGIEVDGLSSGFSELQVVRALDEVSRLLSAKSTLRVGISSDRAGPGSCNDGLVNWCSSNLGNEGDPWADGGQRSLVVIDGREEDLRPEQAVLASLTSRTNAAVKWFTADSHQSNIKHDLSIVAHLGTMNQEFVEQGIRSAIDRSGLTRWRVRKQFTSQNTTFIAESRIGDIPVNVDRDSVAAKMLACVDEMERRCRPEMDSYLFAPHMVKLREAIEASSYTAVSSSNVDAAFFFCPADKAYMWDYELPAYSRRAGENCGYFLLAKESRSMVSAIRTAVSLIGDASTIDDAAISGLLAEISRRGMPTLKRLTAGGAMSLGEVGMLVALRLLQSEFEADKARPSLLPVVEAGAFLNLVVPADPLKNQFEDLRMSLDNRPGVRPDLIVLSIGFASGRPSRLRITPIEVKARKDAMAASDRTSALEQASDFGEFLQRLAALASESELWAVSWRSLLATLLDYGFRVYGQLEQFMQHDEWARKHAAVLRALANGDLDIEIDSRGRLIVVDSVNASAPLDLDSDRFTETLMMSHRDAYSLITDGGVPFIQSVKGRLGTWELNPSGGRDSASGGKAVSPASGGIAIAPRKDAHLAHGACDPQLEFDAGDSAVETPSSGEIPSDEEAVVPSGQDGIRFAVGHSVREFTPEEVFFFPGNTELNQLNVGIVGDLGTGKTQLVQALIYQLRANPGLNRGKSPNILIFDYKKDYSKPEFVNATGARVVEPFDIPLNLFDTRDLLEPRNAWLERFKFFSDVLAKIYSGIGPAQREKIKDAVRDAFNSCANGRSPTIGDVFEVYRRDRGGSVDSPYAIMSDLVDGGYFVADSAKVVPFSEFLDGVVVLDLARVGSNDQAKNMLVVVFLNLFYDHMLRIQKQPVIGREPSLRFVDTMLLVDEAENIMRYDFEVLKRILLQGREFGVGVLLASQYLSHFRSSHENYLEPLLTWFIHKVPNITVKDLEGIGLTGVNSDLVDSIKSLACHECLFKTLGVDGRIIRATPFFELL
jgi:DNA phosphorothioation-dependent restriction protein DptH